MRDTGSILGYASLPAILAVLAVLPFAADHPAPSPSDAAEGPAVPTTASAAFDPGPDDFRVGRQMVAELRGDVAHADSSLRARTLIALLPDVDRSSLDWMFDAHLSGLRPAAELAGYVVHRIWMPDPSRVEAIPGGGPALREAEVVPGVMVFRGNGGASL